MHSANHIETTTQIANKIKSRQSKHNVVKIKPWKTYRVQLINANKNVHIIIYQNQIHQIIVTIAICSQSAKKSNYNNATVQLVIKNEITSSHPII